LAWTTVKLSNRIFEAAASGINRKSSDGASE